ncbi:MAG: IclR family transcriptional regulator [Chitinophagaceae bacterium]|nr:IclR family transcriptional regulator [Chitinophagaceae bacterium]
MVLVVIKTFDILELVAQANGQGITLTEISQQLQINQATASNIIKTMVTKGYIEHIGKKKGYRLGPAAFRLTNEVPYGQDLVNAARDVMEDLTAKLNESSILGTLRNNKRYVLHIVKSNQEIQVQVRTDRNAYETASGRLLMAYLSEKELERFLVANGLPDKTLWKEASTLKGLTESLAKIKKESIAITHLVNRHVRGFAVPILAHDQVVAGLSVFLPDYRYSVSRQKEIIQSLREASRIICQRLNQL